MAEKSKRDHVPRDLERAGALCLAFVNSAAPGRDDRRRKPVGATRTPLASYTELVSWGQHMGILGAPDGELLGRLAAEAPAEAEAALVRARDLRDALLRLFTAVAAKQEPRAGSLEALNAALPASRVIPGPAGFRWDLGEGPEVLDKIPGVVAFSAARLLTSEKVDKVRQCAADGCFRLFVFRSSRRLWCDMNLCGNRRKGRRHQQRKRWAREAPPLRLKEAHRRFEIAELEALASGQSTE